MRRTNWIGTRGVLVVGLMALGVSCDEDDLTEQEKEELRQRVQDEADDYMTEWIDSAFGSDAPPDPCDGGQICKGPSPDNSPPECQDCEVTCTGSGDKDSWTGDAGCEQLKKSKNFSMSVSVAGVGGLTEGTASVQTTASIWSSAMQRASLSDPEEPANGEDPATIVTWRVVFDYEMTFDQTVTVTYGPTTVQVEVSFETISAGFTRCETAEAGETCGDDSSSSTTGYDSYGSSSSSSSSSSTGYDSYDSSSSSSSSSSTGYDSYGTTSSSTGYDSYDGGGGDYGTTSSSTGYDSYDGGGGEYGSSSSSSTGYDSYDGGGGDYGTTSSSSGYDGGGDGYDGGYDLGGSYDVGGGYESTSGSAGEDGYDGGYDAGYDLGGGYGSTSSDSGYDGGYDSYEEPKLDVYW
ncbi:MAG: hypothetical protein K0V04_06780 [Deltaproteobacteria bacterium]|nr:hypothetical protein [Deltaproteobacteria bacterium]